MSKLNFPDLPHFKQLQKDLWRWPVSKAALMVGAGLSKNANRLPGFDKGFPTWRSLVRVMFDELYPPKELDGHDDELERQSRFDQMDALRLASEYEAAFDRGKLDWLIRKENPDEHHEPGKLHELLLDLPWRDVFTTNYDTLLERTEVSDRVYQPVFSARDLTDTFSPRIIKLHGSFPSHPPFIITEDDYRTYPQKKAPFVNTVQQSLIENSLVMIGFSGDDPNFLSWVGWIRDELGDVHSPIYLVGALNMEPSQRALLNQRGVTPIDLAPLFQGKVSSPSDLYRFSLEWFLKSLQKGRPETPENWLSTSSRWDENEMVGGLQIIGDSRSALAATNSSPRGGKLEKEDFLKTMKWWIHQRRTYPGWLILEHKKRASLWDSTKMWVDDLIGYCKDQEAILCLLVANEITWRLNTAMAPNLLDWHPFLVGTLEGSLPLLMDLTTSSTRLIPEIFEGADLRQAWSRIALALLRDYRENFDLTKWSDLLSQAKDLVVSSPALFSDFQHEKVLHALWNLDHRRAELMLREWRVDATDPLNQMRKAGAYAELDKLSDSKRLLEQALKAIRKSISLQGRGVEMLSLEGWCLSLIFAVRCSLNLHERSRLLAEYRERWKELRSYDCDPWLHIEFFNQVLTPEPPELKIGEQKIYRFDPGKTKHTHNWKADHLGPSLPALAYLRLLEQTGLPFKLAGQDVVAHKLANALRWLSCFCDYWSPCVLVRAGRLKDFDEKKHLSRVQVAGLSQKQAERMADWALLVIARELPYLGQKNTLLPHQHLVLSGLPEIISRLSMWLNDERLEKSFGLAIIFGKSLAVQCDDSLSKKFSEWIERIVDSVGKQIPSEWIVKVLQLPVWGEDEAVSTTLVRGSGVVVGHFPYDLRLSDNGCIQRKIDNQAERLLVLARSEAKQTRNEAIGRLRWLYYSEKLTPLQQQQLGEILWKGVKQIPPEMPDGALVNLLYLPSATGIERSEEVKKILFEDKPVKSVRLNAETGSGRSYNPIEPYMYHRMLSYATAPYFKHDRHFEGVIKWSQKEVVVLSKQLFEWWDNEKLVTKRSESEGLKPFEVQLPGSIREATKHMALFLMRAVRWKEKGHKALRKKVARFTEEAAGYEVFLYKLQLYEVVSGDRNIQSIIDSLVEALSGENFEQIREASDTVFHWALLHKADRLDSPHPSVVSKLIERVAFRRREALKTSMQSLRCLVEGGGYVLSKTDLTILSGSIDTWLKATQLSNGNNSEFEIDERPELLEDFCLLIGSLLKLPPSVQSRELNKQIERVRNFASVHPLPEIRRVFTE